MKEELILTEQEIAEFYNRFVEERRFKQPIISAIILATFKGQEKLFDVKIDTVQATLRSETIKQNAASFEGFKLLISSGIISIYPHEKELSSTFEVD